ncbi:MAG: endonuclease/exonuclease/phosphatase family protein [Phycisphaeraceae bacterium]|nr:endonuclease/exonuclease/phosphatase family protein [Phycisphaeraceae bacterium]MCW5763322.1 endonuclease/exonuclease/phosphatase family protein [Phycisphaeraceae bacterium]
MRHRFSASIIVAVLTLVWFGATSEAAQEESRPVAIRVATFNLQDVRPSDIGDGSTYRLRQLAETIQRIRPSVILLNEIAFAAPDDYGRETTGSWTAEQFAERYIAVAQRQGLEPIRYRVFTARTNTGMPSGFDLDRSGEVVSSFPAPRTAKPDGTHHSASDEARAYAGDAWGWGEFPGQYGMAILVDERLDIVEDRVRTFRLFPWMGMPNALLPTLGTDEEESMWYEEEALELFRLSSKSHWDVPVKMPNGTIVHFLASHPTPPAFDGDELRNRKRNHDEIRFWADYILNADYIVDDEARRGGLRQGSSFVILGDLNADPDKGNSYRNPMRQFLLDNPAINSQNTPTSDFAIEGLEPHDTAHFRLRVDYILPSSSLRVLRSGIWRWSDGQRPSDHFPVWMDVVVPNP